MEKYEIKDGVGIIPEGTTEIEYGAFEDCKDLTSVTIPNSVTEIKSRAFEGCTGLMNIVIPDSVTKIEEYTFEGCTCLTDIVIPNSVTKIGYSAFKGCTGLTNIVIPDSVETIYYDTFNGCTGLTSIIVSEGNKVYDSRDNCNAIIETASNTLITGCKNTIIPDSVTKIDGGYSKGAFSDCTGLIDIVIPDSVKVIGKNAFSGCTGLTSITLGTSTNMIGKDAFENCGNLKQIVLRVADPSQIEIERGVELGGYQATLYVPDKKSVSAYKKKALWKKYAGIEILAMSDDSFLKAEKETATQNKVFLEQLGIKEPIALSPIPSDCKSEEILSVVYNIDESDLPYKATLEVAGVYYMLVDDKSNHSMKKEVSFNKAGKHIIRILPYSRTRSSWQDFSSYSTDRFPGSELIKLPDRLERFLDNDSHPLDGAKKLLLGTNYCGGFRCLHNFDEIEVVPENPYMEMRDGCIVWKETQELRYMPAHNTEIPNSVKGILDGALDMYSAPVLRIPGSVKEYTHITNQNIKEIIFEEGVLRAYIFRDFGRVFLQAVHIPSSLEILELSDTDMDTLVVPTTVRVINFVGCDIKHLEIQGDVSLQKEYCFRGFIGEIFLSGSIKPFEEIVAGQPGVQKFMGKMSDDCIIHVKDESVAQTLRECTDFNPKVKVIIS